MTCHYPSRVMARHPKPWRRMAERVGFEPTCPLLAGKTLSRRPRYDRFGTSPRKLENRSLRLESVGEQRRVYPPDQNSSLRPPLHPPAPAAKEIAQDLCAIFRKHSRHNLNPMIQSGVVEDRKG